MGLCAELPNHIPACRFKFNLAKSGLHVDDESFSFEIERVMPFFVHQGEATPQFYQISKSPNFQNLKLLFNFTDFSPNFCMRTLNLIFNNMSVTRRDRSQPTPSLISKMGL